MDTEIINWLEGEKKYDTGIALFAHKSKNKMLIRCLTLRPNAAKLEYELKKLAGIPLCDIFRSNSSRVLKHTNHTNKEATPDIIPEIVQRAKNIVSDLYTQISTMHRKLFETGDGNDTASCKLRAAILAERLPLIDMYDRIWIAKEDYFITGKITKELQQLIKEYQEHFIGVNRMMTKDAKPDESIYAEMSDFELAKKKGNLSAQITKTNNMLKYQSIRKLEEECLMPDGAKKDKLVAKLKTLKDQYSLIVAEIEKRNA